MRKINFVDLEEVNSYNEVIVEPKLDGFNITLRVKKGLAIGITRSGKERFRRECSLPDGEYYGEWIFGTEWAQKWRNGKVYDKVVLYDVLMRNTYYGRLVFLYKLKLDNWIGVVDHEFVKLQGVKDKIKVIKKKAREWIKKGYEGIVVRFPDKSYNAIRLKKELTEDYVIIGYEMSDSEKYKKNNWIRNLVLGGYKDGKLVQIMKVGSMSEEWRNKFSRDKEKYLGKVVEIKGYEKFKSGALRHPSFVRLRNDKIAKECIF